MDNICTEEQIVSGCYDVTKNNKRTISRYLEENCDTIGENIKNKDGFSKVFDLNYGTVYMMAFGIFILLYILISSVILNILSCCCQDVGGIYCCIAIFTYFLSLVLNLIFLLL